MSNYKPKVGDTVRIVIEGEVRNDWGNSVFVVGGAGEAGSTLATKADYVVSVEQIKPALQVGWHRVLPADDMEAVTAMYWSGTDWKYNESTSRSSINRWTSVGYLGTGVTA